MKLPEENIESIKENFGKLQTTSDLTVLLNYAFGILYPDKKIKLRTNQIIYYADRRNKGIRYTNFEIAKKNGSYRQIKAPVNALKRIQKAINLLLSVLFEAHPNATGFTQGKSLLDNANPHVGKYYIYNIDLKDFFPSITYFRVNAVLQLSPFNLPDELACIIANLCCDEGTLPQGAPTSPILSNLVCNRLDRILTGLARKSKASYTRYADDLTFSAYSNVFKKGSDFLSELEKTIETQGFTINLNKTRLQGTGYRQIVTGIVVNSKPNLQRETIRNIRAMLNKWQKLGYPKVNEEFKLKNLGKNGKRTELVSHLAGKLSYLKMVRGKNDKLCQKYENQFKDLLFPNKVKKEELISDTLAIWSIAGIEKAISHFNKAKSGNSNPPYRLLIKFVGPVRKNFIGVNQQWILFEDYNNHKRGSFVLFENRHRELMDFIAENKDFKKYVFPGEVITINISRYLLAELGVVDPDRTFEILGERKVDIAILMWDKPLRQNISTSVIRQIWRLEMQNPD